MVTKPVANSEPVEHAPLIRVGDWVRIRNSAYRRVQVIEARGPLGPGGAQVYRVRVRRKPKPVDIEVLAEQLDLLETAR